MKIRKMKKNFLIYIIKNIKSKLVKIKENPKKDENIEYKKIGNKIIGNKESMKIKLK